MVEDGWRIENGWMIHWSREVGRAVRSLLQYPVKDDEASASAVLWEGEKEKY